MVPVAVGLYRCRCRLVIGIPNAVPEPSGHVPASAINVYPWGLAPSSTLGGFWHPPISQWHLKSDYMILAAKKVAAATNRGGFHAEHIASKHDQTRAGKCYVN